MLEAGERNMNQLKPQQLSGEERGPSGIVRRDTRERTPTHVEGSPRCRKLQTICGLKIIRYQNSYDSHKKSPANFDLFTVRVYVQFGFGK